MDRVPTTTTCRCGYSSPATLLRCLGCGRRFKRCAHVPSPPPAATAPRRAPAPAVRPPAPRRVEVEPPPFSGRDAVRFGADPPPEPGLAIPTAPLAVLGLVAAAWVGPDAPRTELLSAAALLGAALAARRAVPATSSSLEPALVPPTCLTDDELRDALAAW